VSESITQPLNERKIRKDKTLMIRRVGEREWRDIRERGRERRRESYFANKEGGKLLDGVVSGWVGGGWGAGARERLGEEGKPLREEGGRGNSRAREGREGE